MRRIKQAATMIRQVSSDVSDWIAFASAVSAVLNITLKTHLQTFGISIIRWLPDVVYFVICLL